jgi:hypothetical protein
MKTLFGNILFAACELGWFAFWKANNLDIHVLVAGLLLTFVAYVGGTCFGFALRPRPFNRRQ